MGFRTLKTLGYFTQLLRLLGGWVNSAGRVLLLALALAACTVVPIDQGAGSAAAPGSGGKFNAASYVDSIWDSKVVPTVVNSAVDINTLMDALQKDPNAASQKYGHQANGQDNFSVKGQGKVSKVDTSGPNGLITVDIPSTSGSRSVIIQIGPLVLGQSLRDALGFIQFGDFTNQIDYGAVSGALDDRVAKDVVGKLKASDLQGKTVSFYGTFTLGDLKSIVITPVKLDVTG
jgi:predicted lipoprotein